MNHNFLSTPPPSPPPPAPPPVPPPAYGFTDEELKIIVDKAFDKELEKRQRLGLPLGPFSHLVSPKKPKDKPKPPARRRVRKKKKNDIHTEKAAEPNDEEHEEQYARLSVDDFLGPTPLSLPLPVDRRGLLTTARQSKICNPIEGSVGVSAGNTAAGALLPSQDQIFAENEVTIANRKRYCVYCNDRTVLLILKNNHHCHSCRRPFSDTAPYNVRANGRVQHLWEDLGLNTFMDIDDETGLEEERVMVRSGKMPNTPEFWMDWYIAEQASKTSHTDLRMLYLNMMRTMNQNTIPKTVSKNPNMDTQASECETASSGIQPINPVPPYGTAFLKDSNGLLSQLTTWDHMLFEMKFKSKMLRGNRKYTLQGRKAAAGWAIWETYKRRLSRGEFIEDEPGRCWLLHAPGDDGEVIKKLELGYRRQGVGGDDGTPRGGNGEHWVGVGEGDGMNCVSEQAIVDDDNHHYVPGITRYV